ncbi:hypothetical protein BA195_10220 [Tenacibaculum soleae]|uniref:Uncharacterized protein n=1 Tax=Tenacibaculum soleae TaxID=447689 RepID=A0A1B9XYD8_9FLAO|nr:hypothetical protein [Tenacibaculum soleae]OCK42542.1 hypothetical protein BA195_10220 [Tenacibaculum soleae]
MRLSIFFILILISNSFYAQIENEHVIKAASIQDIIEQNKAYKSLEKEFNSEYKKLSNSLKNYVSEEGQEKNESEKKINELKKLVNIKFKEINEKYNFNAIELAFFPEPKANSNTLSFKDRVYINDMGIEAYKENLSDVVGKIIMIDDKGKSTMLISDFKKDKLKRVQFIPKNGEIETFKYKKGDDTNLGLFLSANVKSEEIIEYSTSDISRLVISDKEINLTKLKLKLTELEKNYKNCTFKIISGATVTQITSRKFIKKDKKIKASSFPVLGSAFTFDKHFYISTENYKRVYRIGLSTFNVDSKSI